jgi:hypothetical protein
MHKEMRLCVMLLGALLLCTSLVPCAGISAAEKSELPELSGGLVHTPRDDADPVGLHVGLQVVLHTRRKLTSGEMGYTTPLISEDIANIARRMGNVTANEDGKTDIGNVVSRKTLALGNRKRACVSYFTPRRCAYTCYMCNISFPRSALCLL